MESIEKLRRFIYDQFTGETFNYGMIIVDEIEREIADKYKYMLLPVDADGVPWTKNDTEFDDGLGRVARIRFIAFSITNQRWYLLDDEKHSFTASLCRHVKPDPLKELLSELANDVWEASCTCQTTWSDSGLDGIEERYAERIRELLSGDAE